MFFCALNRLVRQNAARPPVRRAAHGHEGLDMKQDGKGSLVYQASHILMLASYTILAAALVVETLLMGWERWALVPIAVCIAVCWFLHIRRLLTDNQRLWIYTLMMMGTFFFYGIHVTSTFDMAPLMLVEIMIYTTTGERKVIWAALVTYYVTLAFDIGTMIRAGTVWDGLLISRTALHVFLMVMAGWLAQVIIRQWATLFHRSDEQIEDLNESAKRIYAFLANLSHELRTPINAILGITGDMLTDETDGYRRGRMNDILTAGRRLEMRSGDILDYYELETGNLVVNAGPCALSSLFDDLVSLIRPAVPAGLALLFDIDPAVPAVLTTDADKLKKILYHLVSNALSFTKEGGVLVRISCVRRAYGVNLLIEVTDTGVGMTDDEVKDIFQQFYQAESGRGVRAGGLGLGLSVVSGFVRALGGFMTLQSQPDAGTTVSVSLPTAVADDTPCLKLDDPARAVIGVCMDLRRVSSPHVRDFYTTTLKTLATGLGVKIHRVDSIDALRKLSASIPLTHLFIGETDYRAHPDYFRDLSQQMIVTVVDSADTVAVAPGIFVIPKPFYGFGLLDLLGLSPAESGFSGTRMLCSGVRALVVDDEPMNLMVASVTLRRYGMTVTTAESGQEAVSACEHNGFDVIFIDYMMPEMDGLEAMRQIRHAAGSSNSRVPVVMLTANTLSASRELFTGAGVDGIVGKPIRQDELERALRKVLPPASIRYGDAPSEGKKTAEAAPADGLAALGVDTKKGLHYCQGDEAFYHELLAQFASENPSKIGKLQQFLEAGDYANYAIVVHALKSTSKMIGASALSETARSLEEAAVGGDAGRVRELHGGLLEDLRALTDAILAQGAADVAWPEDEVFEFVLEEGAP